MAKEKALERIHHISSHWHLVVFLSESWHIAGQMIFLDFFYGTLHFTGVVSICL